MSAIPNTDAFATLLPRQVASTGTDRQGKNARADILSFLKSLPDYTDCRNAVLGKT